MLVPADEAGTGIAEQECPRIEQRAAGIRTIGKRSGQDQGDADLAVALLERPVARPEAADHLAHAPAGAGGDLVRDRCPWGRTLRWSFQTGIASVQHAPRVAIFPKRDSVVRRMVPPWFAHGEKRMLDHVSIGVGDIARTKRFYDAALAPLGYKCLSEGADLLGYGARSPAFWISASAHPVPADPESGLHFCFAAPSRKSVDEFHAAALKTGGRDNGRPGLRADYEPDYYAAFAVDPDGYRIEAYCSHT